MKSKILIKRRLLEIDTPSKNAVYLASKLINQFGIFVDKPEFLSDKNLKDLSNFYGVNIPSGFYENPQDLQYFTTDELYLEQLISYINISINGEYSLDEKVFERIELFSKVLPNYKKGEEIKLRKYSLISKEEVNVFLNNLTDTFCKYTRPWSAEELVEFKWLYLNGYYKNQYLNCRDNAISLFLEFKNSTFAKMLDKKDIVKMSLKRFGKKTKLDISDDDKIIFDIAIKNAKDCPMSLSQSKYFNSILKNIGSDCTRADNAKSPYKTVIALLSEGKVIEASKVFAENGSLLERNLVFLLSRANLEEASEIIKMLKAENPIVLMQLLIGIICDDYSTNRTFSFIKYNGNLQSHTETDEEYKFRKSKLSIGMKNYLIAQIKAKVDEYYSKKTRIGKIFIDEEFKKISVPLNTSAMGMGLDVLPVGSRLPLSAEYIRVFCYWEKVCDIDMSVVFFDQKENLHFLYWANYAKKEFGKSALTSGDNRSSTGAEFCDFKTKEIKKLGYKKAVVVLNGYGSKLDTGKIYCGYQNKDDLNTKTWDPKNIAMKINVKGDTNCYVAFAIDFETNEIIIINQNIQSSSNVVNKNNLKGIMQYFNKDYITNFNMFNILSNLGELVENPEDADILFSSNKEPNENQKVIRPYNIESLVELLR